MITLSFPVKCPWCNDILERQTGYVGQTLLPYTCWCGEQEIAKNITFIVEALSKHNDPNWYIDYFGLFLNYPDSSFLSFNYNYNKSPKVEISLISMGNNDRVLGKIDVPDLSSQDTFQYAKTITQKYNKLIVFS